MGLDELKAHIHQLVENATDEQVLRGVETQLAQASTLPEPTPEEWARYSIALEQARRGEAIPAREFFANLKAQIEERRKNKCA